MPERVKSLDDIIGQKQIVEAIKKYKETDSLPSVLLFSGVTGVGKTNVAMLTSLYFNNLDVEKIEDFKNIPYTEFIQARTVGVKEMEALIERMRPDITNFVEKKKKFFIIDEAHLLTDSARELALTGLEDLHKDVHVILCSTMPEKFIKDLRTRTVEFQFQPASSRNLTMMLSDVDYKGDIELLVDLAEGSYRAMAVYVERIKAGLDPLSAIEEEGDIDNTNPFNILKEILAGKKLSKSSVNYISKSNWYSFAIPFHTMLLNVVTHQQGGTTDKKYASMFKGSEPVVKDLVNFLSIIEGKTDVQKKMLFLVKYGGNK